MMSDEMYRVVDAQRRELFADPNEQTVRQYVVDHFPRHHSNGQATNDIVCDVKMVDDTGMESVYYGGQWMDDVTTETQSGVFVVTPPQSSPSAAPKTTPAKSTSK
jgi:hypothetical protein